MVTTMDRRQFIRRAATGTAAAAVVAAVPLSGFLRWMAAGKLHFKAVAALPKNPLPTYATFVVEGDLDLDRRTGTVTKTLYAGSPEAMSKIIFPGTTRSISVTDLEESGSTIRIRGMVDETPVLGPREKREMWMTIDPQRKLAEADFLGTPLVLKLQ